MAACGEICSCYWGLAVSNRLFLTIVSIFALSFSAADARIADPAGDAEAAATITNADIGTGAPNGSPEESAPVVVSTEPFDDASASATPSAASNPELAAIMNASGDPATPVAGTWSESATRDYYNGTISLAWQNTLGDYLPTLIGSATVPDLNHRQTIDIPVTGNDFYVLNDGRGSAIFFARNATDTTVRPTLIVNGTTSYTATRDVALLSSTASSVGTANTLNDRQAMLIAFDKYHPLQGDTAVLRLTTDTQYTTHTLSVYRPDVRFVFPTIDAVIDPTVVRDIRSTDFTTSATVTVANNVVTGQWGGTRPGALSQVFPLTPANEYYMTVVIKLEKDWPNQGGKLPGLTDTGLGLNAADRPLIVDGVDCANAAWGGRVATGCRWSARTGWGGRSGNEVGLHTYFYAVNPSASYGVVQNWPTPAPVGQWFAYVERVKVNTPGRADGRLSYWICTTVGCAPQFDRQDIVWSNYDFPEAKITEAWADVYCGGTGCPGPNPWKTSTVRLSRMTVTNGLPVMSDLYSEVRALNGLQ